MMLIANCVDKVGRFELFETVSKSNSAEIFYVLLVWFCLAFILIFSFVRMRLILYTIRRLIAISTNVEESG